MAPAFVGADAGAMFFFRRREARSVSDIAHSIVGRDPDDGRPLWVRRGVAHEAIVAVEAEQVDAGRRVYRVRLVSGERLLLSYRLADQSWGVTPVTAARRPETI